MLDEAGRPVEPGETGVLHVRGPHIMMGYWRSPELTAEKVQEASDPAARTMSTLDHFTVDEDGDLYFVDRSDDIIKTRGEKVSSVEVENALHDVAGVRQAAVVGVPDELLGEAVRAYVLLDEGAALTELDVIRECRTRLGELHGSARRRVRDRAPAHGLGESAEEESFERTACAISSFDAEPPMNLRRRLSRSGGAIMSEGTADLTLSPSPGGPAEGAPRMRRNVSVLAGAQLITWTMTLAWTLVVPRALGAGEPGNADGCVVDHGHPRCAARARDAELPRARGCGPSRFRIGTHRHGSRPARGPFAAHPRGRIRLRTGRRLGQRREDRALSGCRSDDLRSDRRASPGRLPGDRADGVPGVLGHHQQVRPGPRGHRRRAPGLPDDRHHSLLGRDDRARRAAQFLLASWAPPDRRANERQADGRGRDGPASRTGRSACSSWSISGSTS